MTQSELKHKFGIEKIALFGSYARDEANASSDVDLLVDMQRRYYLCLEKNKYYDFILEKLAELK